MTLLRGDFAALSCRFENSPTPSALRCTIALVASLRRRGHNYYYHQWREVEALQVFFTTMRDTHSGVVYVCVCVCV